LTSTLNFCLRWGYIADVGDWFAAWVDPSPGLVAGLDARIESKRVESRVRDDVETKRVADRLVRRLVAYFDRAFERLLADDDRALADDGDVDAIARIESNRVDALAALIGRDFDFWLDVDDRGSRDERVARRSADARAASIDRTRDISAFGRRSVNLGYAPRPRRGLGYGLWSRAALTFLN
jgi:hypothetical protein